MKLTVKAFNDQKYEVDVEGTLLLNVTCDLTQSCSRLFTETFTVAQLKEAVHTASGTPAGQQRLIYTGKVLSDAEPITKYNIKEGHVIHLVRSTTTASSASPSTAAPAASTPAPAAAPQTPSTPTQPAAGAVPPVNPFAGTTRFLSVFFADDLRSLWHGRARRCRCRSVWRHGRYGRHGRHGRHGWHGSAGRHADDAESHDAADDAADAEQPASP